MHAGLTVTQKGCTLPDSMDVLYGICYFTSKLFLIILNLQVKAQRNFISHIITTEINVKLQLNESWCTPYTYSKHSIAYLLTSKIICLIMHSSNRLTIQYYTCMTKLYLNIRFLHIAKYNTSYDVNNNKITKQNT